MTRASKSKKRVEDEMTTEKNLFVVGIGASAGGLEAIHEFFDNIPENNDLSFVIVQHLSPDYKSLMAELLTKHTKMQVYEAEDGMEVLEQSVYVIPNKKNLIIKEGRLRLLEKTNTASPNNAIDIFFESLAQDKGKNAIAVVLSGTGSDGTKGINLINKNGGLVIVQDPLTAKFDGMPNSAISTGNVDYILPPELIYDEIHNHIKQGPIGDTFPSINSQEHEAVIVEIMELIRNHTTYDFTYYKRPTIHRRIIRRMVLHNVKTIQDYLDYLYSTPAEIHLLSKEFLIGVTKFFRDGDSWEIIKKRVIPEIIAKKNFNDPVKIWVAGCSTGEEAYSLAIMFNEELALLKKELNIKIFATDIDKEALDFAAKGCYPETIEHDVSSDRIEKYFVKEGNKYQINSQIRKMVIFANHDLIKDPPFSKIDLISCRNLLIYLNPLLQKKVLGTFHFSMNLGGYLFLGSSESVGDVKNFLVDVDKKWKIYKNIHPSKGLGFENLSHGYNVRNVSSPTIKVSKSQLQNNFTEVLNDVIIDEFGYAGVYVDENYELLHAIGDFKKFIELPDKKLNLNLLKMVPEELTIPLGTSLRKAVKNYEKSVIKNIRIKNGKNIRLVNIIVSPHFDENRQLPKFVLVLFYDSSSDKHVTEKATEFYNSDVSNSQRIHDLEFELKETKENLQSAIEELETSNEELQSANEELLSANEELQSTNEELQSLNEELHTVNSEHQVKIKELIELNDDLNNYFRTSQIGQVYLDKFLNIRRYTPVATRQINLIESDIGRPITHISSNLKYDNLMEDLRYVLNSKENFDKEIQLNDNEWYIMKITPYIRQDRLMDGLVITFMNITKLKELNDLVSGVLNSSLNGIMALKPVRNSKNQIVDFECVLSNQAFADMFNKHRNYLVGKRMHDEFPDFKNSDVFEQYKQVVENGVAVNIEREFSNGFLKGYYNIVGVQMGDGLVLTFTDISETKSAEEKVRLAYEEVMEAQKKLKELNQDLEKRVDERTIKLKQSEEYLKQTNENLRKINNDLDNFIYTASHDLKAPISNIEGLVDALDSVLIQAPDIPEVKEIIELMRFSVNKFKETIKDLTEISKIQKEKIEDVQEVDVLELLNEIELGIKEVIQSSNTKIELELNESKIRFSKKNLRSIFYNLISNAIKYKAPGRNPHIKIKTEKKDGFVLFSISDNGLGIPEKHQGKIFSMFKRFHDHVDGTGIGLYIVKRILDNEGGVINVDSHEGKGSTFNVYFKQ